MINKQQTSAHNFTSQHTSSLSVPGLLLHVCVGL